MKFLRPVTVDSGLLTCEGTVLLVIEPIFEADFEGCSFGFRPKRNAHQALDQIQAALKAGRTAVMAATAAACSWWKGCSGWTT